MRIILRLCKNRSIDFTSKKVSNKNENSFFNNSTNFEWSVTYINSILQTLWSWKLLKLCVRWIALRIMRFYYVQLQWIYIGLPRNENFLFQFFSSFFELLFKLNQYKQSSLWVKQFVKKEFFYFPIFIILLRIILLVENR